MSEPGSFPATECMQPKCWRMRYPGCSYLEAKVVVVKVAVVHDLRVQALGILQQGKASIGAHTAPLTILAISFILGTLNLNICAR